MELIDKITVLADAAKYDASCASSGSIKRNWRNGKGVGSTSAGMGICHSYAPDGRCISLLKILLTNFCIYDCSYCINRSSSSVQRARFSVDEIVNLTLDFYKRNYIEGLFLSSGIIQSSDYTMEQLVRVAKSLRQQEDFRGYIHLKSIPDASPELLHEAGLYADRLSINVELPSRQSLAQLAPEKSPVTIQQSMGELKTRIDESKEQRRNRRKVRTSQGLKPKAASRIYAPAGQSTQMIIGADGSSDGKILRLSHQLYDRFQMRRVYYSAFSPIPNASQTLPAQPPPLMREHRLYQADWLLRFYGFQVDEIVAGSGRQSQGAALGMLDLDVDPKLSWALRNRDFFPVNINSAPKEVLLRVPGIGAIGAQRIIRARRSHPLRYAHLAKCGLSVKKVAPFVETCDHNPQQSYIDRPQLKDYFVRRESPQMALF